MKKTEPVSAIQYVDDNFDTDTIVKKEITAFWIKSLGTPFKIKWEV